MLANLMDTFPVLIFLDFRVDSTFLFDNYLLMDWTWQNLVLGILSISSHTLYQRDLINSMALKPGHIASI